MYVVCYRPGREFLSACGRNHSIYTLTRRVVPDDNKYTMCEDCRATEQYKQDLITFEIGCDGDWEKWGRYWHGRAYDE